VNSDAISEEIKQHSKNWKGKILFLTGLSPKHINPLRSFSQLGSLLTAAAKSKAIAVISSAGRPGIMLTHTGPAAFQDSSYSTPVLDLAIEQQQLLQRLLIARKPVRMKLSVQNSLSPKSVVCSNVVGEIPGADHPEEVVLVCAHLDSWDLGTGAIDDASGVASVLSSAEAIVSQQVRPKRTIRFVLFTGEEQGLLGSLAYVRNHKKDLKNFVCAFAMDWGPGPIIKLPLAGHDELVSVFEHFVQTVSDIGEVRVDTSYLSFTDGYAFTLAGIPGIAPLQNSPDYALVGHSAADTLDKVDRKSLTENTAILASMSYWVANYPIRLGMPWTQAKTLKALIRDGQKPLLDLFGLWKIASAK
jgi:Zn-dependent M28 family amino/carboxypeptidase